MTRGTLRQRCYGQRHAALTLSVVVAFAALIAIVIAVGVRWRFIDEGVVVFSSVGNVYMAKQFDSKGRLLMTCTAGQCTKGASSGDVVGRATRGASLGQSAEYTRASDKVAWVAHASRDDRKLFFIPCPTPDGGYPERISFEVNTAQGTAAFPPITPGITMKRGADEPGTWRVKYDAKEMPLGMSVDAVLSFVVRFDVSYKMSTMWWSASPPWQGDAIRIGRNWAFQEVVRDQATGKTMGRITRSYRWGPIPSLLEMRKIRIDSVEDGRRIAHLQHTFSLTRVYQHDKELERCDDRRYFDKSQTILVSICHKASTPVDPANTTVIVFHGLKTRGTDGGYAADIVNDSGDVIAHFSRTEGTIVIHGRGVTLPLLATLIKLATSERLQFA